MPHVSAIPSDRSLEQGITSNLGTGICTTAMVIPAARPYALIEKTMVEADGLEGGRMADRKRPPISIWIGPLLIGLVGVYRVTQSPSFGLYRSVDIVQLLGSGVCFGATMVGVIFMLRGSRP